MFWRFFLVFDCNFNYPIPCVVLVTFAEENTLGFNVCWILVAVRIRFRVRIVNFPSASIVSVIIAILSMKLSASRRRFRTPMHAGSRFVLFFYSQRFLNLQTAVGARCQVTRAPSPVCVRRCRIGPPTTPFPDRMA